MPAFPNFMGPYAIDARLEELGPRSRRWRRREPSHPRARRRARADERSRQFADDLKLPFDNALLYNEDTSDVANSARVAREVRGGIIESLRYEEPPNRRSLYWSCRRRRSGGLPVDGRKTRKLPSKNWWRSSATMRGTRWPSDSAPVGARGAEQHWEVMRGTHAFARKRKGPPPEGAAQTVAEERAGAPAGIGRERR